MTTGESEAGREPSASLLRRAFEQVERLLSLDVASRSRELESLAISDRLVHAQVATLLRAAERATAANFLVDGAVGYFEGLDIRPALQAGDQLGNYRVEAPLGAGGMGEVWRARRTDGAYDTPVAIKALHAHLAQGAVRGRFAREGRILGALAHPHIGRLLDAGVSDRDELYLVLEYIDGMRIDEWCDSKRLGLVARIHIFRQVCDAVAYAHAHMVVHRDLKPSNILVTGEGNAKLLDFGIAKLVAGDGLDRPPNDMTQLGERALTPDYASPEQMRGEVISAATDVYALGIVLYTLLSGRRPYDATGYSPQQLEQEVMRREFASPSQISSTGLADLNGRAANRRDLRRALRGDLDAIVRKALRKEPGDRYPDARALGDDLDRYLRHEPVQARAGARAYVFRRFVRRNWLAVGAASMVLLAILIGTAGILWQAQVARTEEAKALAVKNFLLDVFQQNSVHVADVEQARRTTAQQLLDISSSRIVAGLQDQPEVRDELLATMGDLYDQLELYDNATTLSRARLDSLKARGGAPSSALADAEVNLGHYYYMSENFAMANTTLHDALQTMDQLKDLSSGRRALALLLLGRLDFRTQPLDFPETQQLLQAAADIYNRCCPADGDRVGTMGTLGRLAERRGDDTAAERYYRATLAAFQEPQLAAASRLDVGRAYDDLGSFLLKRHRYREADEDLTMADEILVRSEGAEALDVNINKAFLGQAELAVNHAEHGEALVVEAAKSIETTQGPDKLASTELARAMAAALQLTRGEFAPAADNMDRIRVALLHLRQVDAATCSIRCAQYLGLAARLSLAQGQVAAARDALTLSDDALRRLHGEKGEAYAVNRTTAAQLNVLDGRIDQARGQLQTVMAEHPAVADDLPDPYFLASIADIELDLQQGDAMAASSKSRHLLEQLAALPDPQYFADWEAQAQRVLGTALTLGCKAADADAPLRRALYLRSRIDVADSPWLAQVRIDLAENLLAQRALPEARALLAQAGQAQSRLAALGPRYTIPLQRARTHWQQVRQRSGGERCVTG
jgi:hypothetical protein